MFFYIVMSYAEGCIDGAVINQKKAEFTVSLGTQCLKKTLNIPLLIEGTCNNDRLYDIEVVSELPVSVSIRLIKAITNIRVPVILLRIQRPRILNLL